MDFKQLDKKRLRRIYKTLSSKDFMLLSEFAKAEKLYYSRFGRNYTKQEQDAISDRYFFLLKKVKGPHKKSEKFIEQELKPLIREIVELKMGKGVVEVTFEEEEDLSVKGSYLPDKKRINISSRMLKSVVNGERSIFDIIHTVLHECRHANQYALFEDIMIDVKSEEEQKFLLEAAEYLKATGSRTEEGEFVRPHGLGSEALVSLYRVLGESRLSEEAKRQLTKGQIRVDQTEEQIREVAIGNVQYFAYADAVIERDARLGSTQEMMAGFDDLFSMMGVKPEEAKTIRDKFFGSEYIRDGLRTESGHEVVEELRGITVSKSELLDLFQRMEDIGAAVEILRQREDLQQNEDYAFLQKRFYNLDSSLSVYKSCMWALLYNSDVSQLLTYLEFIEDEELIQHVVSDEVRSERREGFSVGGEMISYVISRKYGKNPEAIEEILKRLETNPKLATFLGVLNNEKIDAVAREYMQGQAGSETEQEEVSTDMQTHEEFLEAVVERVRAEDIERARRDEEAQAKRIEKQEQFKKILGDGKKLSEEVEVVVASSASKKGKKTKEVPILSQTMESKIIEEDSSL